MTLKYFNKNYNNKYRGKYIQFSIIFPHLTLVITVIIKVLFTTIKCEHLLILSEKELFTTTSAANITKYSIQKMNSSHHS